MSQTTEEIKIIYPTVSREVIRSMKGLITADSNFYKVDFELINTNTIFNERIDYGDIEEFANELWENGQQNPLIGTFVEKEDGSVVFDLIEGFRRQKAWAHNKSIGRKIGQILCQNKKMTLEERYTTMFATQHFSKQFTSLEVSNILRKMLEIPLSEEKIAESINKSITYVKDMLELSKQSEHVKQAVSKKQTSATAANKVSKALGAEAAQELIDKSISQNKKFTVRDAEDVINKKKAEKKGKTLATPELSFVIPYLMKDMKAMRDEILAIPKKTLEQERTLKDLDDKIAVRQAEWDAEINGIKNNLPERNYISNIGREIIIDGTTNFDSILLTKFNVFFDDLLFQESMGLNPTTTKRVAGKIFDYFKNEIEPSK